jgi:type IX secretion system PorP/SprF family membrane protein
MRGLKKYIAIITIVFSCTKSYAQQTVQFSQYMFNGLAVNPAYAGYKEDWTLNLSSRLQWTGVDGAPKTNTISVDGVTNGDKKNVGLGLLVTNDRLGPENNTSAYINYSYRIRLNDEDTQRLCFGIAAGVIQYSLNGSLFNGIDANDPNAPTGNQSNVTPDFRAGVYYYSPSYYFGASMLNLLPQSNVNPASAIITQERTLYLTTGFIFPLSEVIDWKPSVMVKEDFKSPTNIDAAMYFIFGNVIWVGGGYSSGVVLWNKPNLQTNLNRNDELTGSVAFNISSRCRIGYSYDFVTSQLPGYQTGSHELSFSLAIGRSHERILSPRYF